MIADDKKDEVSYMKIKTTFDLPEYIDVKLPKWFLDDMKVMSQVVDMKKRAFLFFKRSLSPAEKMAAYHALTMKPAEVKEN